MYILRVIQSKYTERVVLSSSRVTVKIREKILILLDGIVYRLKVREVAQSKGFTISSLSRVANVPIRTVRQAWNNDQYEINLKLLHKIAKALNVSTTELLEDVPNGEE
jgi:DNA-binding Xre family transcriptional regulator